MQHDLLVPLLLAVLALPAALVVVLAAHAASSALADVRATRAMLLDLAAKLDRVGDRQTEAEFREGEIVGRLDNLAAGLDSIAECVTCPPDDERGHE